MEAFYTLQGEGCHTGTPAWFIRLGGCDVGCHWCDVKESWDAERHPLTPVEAMVKNVEKKAEIIVITGGEPLMYELGPLTESLRNKGFKTHIETSGAYSLSGHWDWICLSPKKVKLPLPAIYGEADELKIIIYNKDDFRFAEQEAAKVNKDCRLYLQPEWGRREKMMPLIVDHILENPKWRVSLQTHKYLGIE